jgi:hypothetical protein
MLEETWMGLAELPAPLPLDRELSLAVVTTLQATSRPKSTSEPPGANRMLDDLQLGVKLIERPRPDDTVLRPRARYFALVTRLQLMGRLLGLLGQMTHRETNRHSGALIFVVRHRRPWRAPVRV